MAALPPPFVVLFRGAGDRLLSLVVARGCTFLAGVIILRSLAPAEAGKYFLVVSWASVLAAVASGGATTLVGREVPSFLQSGDTAAAVAASRRALLVGVLVALTLGTGLHVLRDVLVLDKSQTVLVVILAALFASTEVVAGLWRSWGRAWLAEGPAALAGVGFLTLVVVLSWRAGLSLDGLFRVRVAIEVLAAATLVWGARALIRRKGVARRVRPGNRGVAVGLLFSSLALVVILQADVVLLGAARGAEAVGFYMPALRLAEVVTASHAVLAPYVVIAASRTAERDLRGVLDSVTSISVIVAACATAPMLVAPRLLLETLFGPVPSESVAALQIIAAGFLLFSLTGMCIFLSQGLVSSRLLITEAVLVITTTIGGGIALISWLGVTGAAISCALSYLLFGVVSGLGLHHQRGISWITPRPAWMWVGACVTILAVRLSVPESWPGLVTAALLAPLASMLIFLNYRRAAASELT